MIKRITLERACTGIDPASRCDFYNPKNHHYTLCVSILSEYFDINPNTEKLDVCISNEPMEESYPIQRHAIPSRIIIRLTDGKTESNHLLYLEAMNLLKPFFEKYKTFYIAIEEE